MRRLAITPLLLALTLPLAAADRHSNHWGHGLSISFDDAADVRDCSSLRVRSDGQSVPVVEENVPVGNLRSLRVRSDANGGIRAVGTSGSSFAVKACKASALGNVSGMRVNVRGNEVSAERDDEDSRNVVYFLVFTPRGASLDLEAHNGPISVDGVDGTVVARAVNGPIGLKASSGSVDALTTNGPISFNGSSGNVKLRATNGPIAVSLDGAAWGSGSLDAATENGPLSLNVPRNYGSGVLVETDGNSPVSCHGLACAGAKKAYNKDDDDDDFGPRWPRRIELGSGARAITLTTHNGPVSVRDGE